MVLIDLNLTPPDEQEGNISAGNVPEHEDINMEEDDADPGQDDDINMEEEGVDPGQDAGGVQQQKRTRKTLSDTKKYAAYVAMHTLCMCRGGKFQKYDKKNIANFFEVDIQVIQRIWKLAMKQIAEGLPVDVSSKRKGRCGRKPIDIDLSLIPTIPLNKRSTIRSLAWQLGCNPMTLFRKFQLKLIRRHTNALKPPLKEKNKKTRAEFCVSMLDETTTGNASPLFSDMYRIVHADEKWFNMTKNNRTYYLLPDEEEPTRPVPSNCIGKVMFLTAVARPRYDSAGNMTFSGKIGMWPFVQQIPAQRRSENREKGTLETKNLVVTREVMREYYLDKLLPAIKAVWPQEDAGKTIFIQQDNARPHILPHDPAFAEAVANLGLDIKLMQQPANSPDMNVLDLGFFRSLQSLTDCLSTKTLQDFIKGVLDEYAAYKPSLLNKIFLTLQTCMIEVMKREGGNGYKTPHIGKDSLERLKLLPLRLECPAAVYATVLHFLGQDVD